ncbi:hypothetical protein BO71DRAFT_402883 [Aspergillus ellipticus CBS 707.79]|uniref:Uncharacterized protein n=1 Tax=Aspergillus ellipticus CBS 707.79 TaxID=1448320 RepID=A0A319CYK5_9EURO|nr:hypothetical protein BO71DRAFT_402883 [Aspergillus ellipticus CBS 707.79]
MAHPGESPDAIPAHIPDFAKPLLPYIKTRQEALRIRQALTVYLRSQIEFVDNDPDNPGYHSQSHLSLAVPHDAVVDVKRIPPEVTGLRRKYLEALQANVAARKEYQSIVEKTNPTKNDNGKEKAEEPSPDPSSELQEYLKLLRDRRRHAKLQIFQHYLQEIKQRDTLKSGDLEEQGARLQHLTPPEEFEDTQSGSGSTESIEELMHKLERAVIRAKSQLEREKGLLEELKAQRASEPPSDVPPAARLRALQRTRDELVQWVEDKLVSVGNGENSGAVHDLSPEDMEESTRLLEDKKTQIAQQYAAYVDARKRLLDAASRACQPIAPAPAPAKPPTRPSSMVQDKNATGKASSMDPLQALSFTSDVLQPLSKSQRALALQKFYLSGMLAKEKASTLRILNRLSDESHLLPEYPILARQPRFKHATAALASRQGTNPEPAKQDEIVTLAEAWAFASDAAGTNEQEYVEHKLEEGLETAQDAEHVLGEVYNMLNQDLEDALRQGPDGGPGESDIWASEARMTRSQAKSHRSRPPAKGPWVGLNGQVGVGE